jgi:hypothetical protein
MLFSHLPYFLHIAAMIYYSEDEEYFDEDFFKACKTPGHLPMARWYLLCCLFLSGLVIRYDIINTLVFCVYILAVCMTT